MTAIYMPSINQNKKVEFWLPLVWAVFCALVLLWLTVRDFGYFAMFGPVTYQIDLAKQGTLISRLYPEGRLTAPEKVSDGWQQIVLAEPLYVDVAMPKHFRSAVVRVWYKYAAKPPQLGWRVRSASELPYVFVQPSIVLDQSGWSIAEAKFLLTDTLVSRGKTKALIGFADAIKQGSNPFIHHVTVEFQP